MNRPEDRPEPTGIPDGFDHHPADDPEWPGVDDPRVRAGIEHVQRAAHEMIAASRALLDVAEEIVDTPGGVTRLFGLLGELGDVASRRGRPPTPRGAGGPDDDTEPPVQRIPVS